MFNGTSGIAFYEDEWEHILFCMREPNIDERRKMLKDRLYISLTFVCIECSKTAKEVSNFIYKVRLCRKCYIRNKKKLKKLNV